MSHKLSRTQIDEALASVKSHYGCASEEAAFIKAHFEQNMPGGIADAHVDYMLFLERRREKLPVYVTAEAFAIQRERARKILAAE